MLAAYTELKSAQKVKKYLVSKKLMHFDYLAYRELDHIYFPLLKKAKVPNAKVVNTKFTFKQKAQAVTVEDLLTKKLSKKELSNLPRSQEVVGSIMIIEIPDELESKEKEIAQAYLQVSRNIDTVVKKSRMHSGVFRTRRVKILAGKRSKETTHLENGIKLKLHLEKTYFSARSAHERLRIANKIKKGEKVLVMFAGCGPFPLVFARNSKASQIVGVEMNPLAHQFSIENVSMNKFVGRVHMHLGDVREVVPKLKGKFDRIAMPLPKTGEEFLDVALKKCIKGGIIHLYAFLNEKDIEAEARRVKKICKDLKFPVRVLRKVKCGQFSPGTFRVCFDLKVI